MPLRTPLRPCIRNLGCYQAQRAKPYTLRQGQEIKETPAPFLRCASPHSTPLTPPPPLPPLPPPPPQPLNPPPPSPSPSPSPSLSLPCQPMLPLHERLDKLTPEAVLDDVRTPGCDTTWVIYHYAPYHREW